MPCILVADDNTNIQKMVALALEDRGIKVIAVGNGEAAVRRLPDLNPDLVLADVFMPVRNGYEVCEFVKKDKRFANTPVILLVGAFDPLDEKETRRVGADGVLKKPFVPPDPLIAMVISILEKNPRAAAELAAMKPKEAKDALEPHPMTSLEAPPPSAVPFKAEVPLKIEPKPLPDFPEPSPEDAALMYGFGKSRRTFEDDEMEALKEPLAEVDEPVQEEFDGSSTTNDWRRSAMDFEVPAESANTPAFSSEDNLGPMTFPSELDSPSEDLGASNAIEEIEAAAPAPESEAEALVEKAEERFEEAPAPESKSEAGLKSEPELNSEPSFGSKVTHWMDRVASPNLGSSVAGWLDALTAQMPSVVPPAVETDQAAVTEATLEASSGLSESSSPEQSAVASGEVVSRSNSTFDKSADADVAPALLFVNDETPMDSAYNAPREDSAPLQAAPVAASEKATWEAPSAEEVTVHENTSPNGDLSEGSSEPSLGLPDEPMPSALLPYREALSEIPFLNPPPGFDPHASETFAADSDTVDAVVQRVLEKLEPQLHALLSQGVLKPLVENLLQTELAKKDK